MLFSKRCFRRSLAYKSQIGLRKNRSLCLKFSENFDSFSSFFLSIQKVWELPQLFNGAQETSGKKKWQLLQRGVLPLLRSNDQSPVGNFFFWLETVVSLLKPMSGCLWMNPKNDQLRSVILMEFNPWIFLTFLIGNPRTEEFFFKLPGEAITWVVFILLNNRMRSCPFKHD